MLDASLPIDEIKELLSYSDVRTVFTTDELYNKLKDTFEGELNFYKLVNSNKLQPYIDDKINLIKSETVDKEDDVIVIIYSSGTTGKMKGIKVTYSKFICLIIKGML